MLGIPTGGAWRALRNTPYLAFPWPVPEGRGPTDLPLRSLNSDGKFPPGARGFLNECTIFPLPYFPRTTIVLIENYGLSLETTFQEHLPRSGPFRLFFTGSHVESHEYKPREAVSRGDGGQPSACGYHLTPVHATWGAAGSGGAAVPERAALGQGPCLHLHPRPQDSTSGPPG